eukprot:scaffold1140_cov157-Amphora_coffeaeformis.AAC.1
MGETGWFDYQAIRVRRVDDTTYFHNLQKMQQVMRNVFPKDGFVAEPECSPTIQSRDGLILMGESSEEFFLGSCSVMR